ncbi:MAG: ATP-dependent Clp protease adaptor ClpS [Planctomycetaceae bacterium]|jgi:ATP-dependent Clp protease adaptor protein ClpS|nr:ATP-dependent Clp protease adaptor ClpS [Planctomycetaceae bacterium]MBT6484230.1 ATP-dependent Clp protease adaptor ClpS [Planctomycetaceae bacterium]MBT6493179.1 ATP-dependent Clp protease adaptor ClpS [Planctomycetaceae bacterium]
MSDSTSVIEPDVATPATDKKQKTDSKSKPKRQPPYTVIVHNDERHTFEYVIEVLQRVCGHSRASAYLLAEQADSTGKAHVWTGALEVAELKRDQIRGFGTDFYAEQSVTFPLGVTIEPLPGD